MQEAVEKEARAWAKLWRVGEEYDVGDIRPAKEDHPGPITADMVRKACLSFPMQTGLGPDAIQPRAIRRLSDAGIEALAAILIAIETIGEWQRFTQLVIDCASPQT